MAEEGAEQQARRPLPLVGRQVEAIATALKGAGLRSAIGGLRERISDGLASCGLRLGWLPAAQHVRVRNGRRLLLVGWAVWLSGGSRRDGLHHKAGALPVLPEAFARPGA